MPVCPGSFRGRGKKGEKWRKKDQKMKEGKKNKRNIFVTSEWGKSIGGGGII
jgi:hypothetical protein